MLSNVNSRLLRHYSNNFTKTLAVTSVITTEQSAVILNNVHGTVPWHMIIDQANAAAKSNGRFFNKTNQFAQNESIQNHESECSSAEFYTLSLHLGQRTRDTAVAAP